MQASNAIDWRRRAQQLALFTIAYNLLEALACGLFGVKDNSLSLLGFGSDSLIEAASGAVVWWRFGRESGGTHADSAAERRAQKTIGGLLLALALSLAGGAVWTLLRGSGAPSEGGLAGTVISLVSLAVMGLLLRAKMATAGALDSAVLRADAFCTRSCMWLSSVLLAGSFLLLETQHAYFDALASLVMAYLVSREGWENWEAEGSECTCAMCMPQ